MNRTITHKHLKRQFDIFEKSEGVDALLNELEFSTLLLPVNRQEESFDAPVIYFDDMKYVPVFTDVHEFNKCDLRGEYRLVSNEFPFYLNLMNQGVEGIVIDIEGERFPITRDMVDFFDINYSFDYDPQVFTLRQIRHIKDSVDNAELEEFLDDEANHWDHERLMELLLKSDLLTVALSEEDLSGKAEDGVVSLHDVGPLPLALTSRLNESYALIYSSEDEIRPKNNPLHPYAQLVNLPALARRILLDDLDGIILNENSHNITIPRDFLRDFFKAYTALHLCKFDDYVFIMGD